MEQMRKELAAVDAVVVAARSGAGYKKLGKNRGELTFNYFDGPYTVSYPQFEAYQGTTREECPPRLLFLFLHYLHTADGTSQADRWIAFREVPHAMFYNPAFQAGSGDRLVHTFGNDLAGFKEAAVKAGGDELSLGDAAFRFQALPRVPLGVIYWLGDEELAPYAHVLFDKSAGHYLSAEGLSMLGRELCSRIVRCSKDDGVED